LNNTVGDREFWQHLSRHDFHRRRSIRFHSPAGRRAAVRREISRRNNLLSQALHNLTKDYGSSLPDSGHPRRIYPGSHGNSMCEAQGRAVDARCGIPMVREEVMIQSILSHWATYLFLSWLTLIVIANLCGRKTPDDRPKRA
jgi:hypothetical protein